jgi:hypothetical protein
VEYDWDDAKHARNLRERGIGFDDGALISSRGRSSSGSMIGATMARSASARSAGPTATCSTWSIRSVAR